MVHSLKRPESRMAFGSNLVKPSELFGSVKKTINRKPSRCQCKHHQQKLLQKQEEQRIQLQEHLKARGDKRKIPATSPINPAFHTSGGPEPHLRLRKCAYLYIAFSRVDITKSGYIV